MHRVEGPRAPRLPQGMSLGHPRRVRGEPRSGDVPRYHDDVDDRGAADDGPDPDDVDHVVLDDHHDSVRLGEPRLPGIGSLTAAVVRVVPGRRSVPGHAACLLLAISIGACAPAAHAPIDVSADARLTADERTAQ